ncbi:MAG TPA: gamma-glutamylcyclotransferase family protein [Candidatus Xenobia bacterium]|nr:gamma-glutamylcyclotransferase family protein [Candidatus Xenobia bacterium]
MCTGRLRCRVPSAHPLFVTQLSGHVLRFHKRSTDGSGKADAEFTENNSDSVWGVVFEIDAHQKNALDAAEGLGDGYKEKLVQVRDPAGQMYSALMYFASRSHIDPSLKPYSWYVRFVSEGAKQHTLPANYVAAIEAVPSVNDPDTRREARMRAIKC